MSERTLADYVTLQRGNTYKSSLLGDEGPVLLGLASIQKHGGFKETNLKRYAGPSDPRILLKPGDIYVSLKDVTQAAYLLGAVSRVPDNIGEGRLTQDTVKLHFIDSDAPREYFYWILRTPQYREYCLAHSTGTTNLALSRSDFLSFPIPPLTVDRKRCVDLLEDIEKKIDLNRRTNETLEAMARAVFKSWFVDFDPVHAKAAGKAPAHMDAETAALFPDAFGEDGLPVGWEVSTVGDEVTVVGGSTPSTKQPEYWEGGTHHWATPKDLSDLGSTVLLSTARKLTDAGVAKISSGLLPAGTLLMSSRAPIGYLAISEVPVAVNQGFAAMKCEGRLSQHYMLIWCQMNQELVLSKANGSTFLEISKSNFKSLPVLVPDAGTRDAFDRFAG
ncbi:MAG: restriction endonuclease subunit S, partial [Synergistales bacterium]|nr:restriction endonuclease subunit S [Synergistales bacterium]